MSSEFEKQIGLRNFDDITSVNIKQLITEAEKEFPRHKYPSKMIVKTSKDF